MADNNPPQVVSTQSFVQREADKLENELLKTPMDSTLYAQIYAARQALSWSLDPNAFASPYAMLLESASA